MQFHEKLCNCANVIENETKLYSFSCRELIALCDGDTPSIRGEIFILVVMVVDFDVATGVLVVMVVEF